MHRKVLVPLLVTASFGGAGAAPADLAQVNGMTREQLADLYPRLAGAVFQPPDCVAGFEMFDDVPASSPFCGWIEELARRGITGGCTATEYCPSDPVTRAQMATFVVRAVADEAFHVVGEPGEPPFGDGGEGDCLWQNPPPEALPGISPVSFLKDSDGFVRLAGVPFALDGAGGDMSCDMPTDDASDAIVFELPAGYQPEHLKVFPGADPTASLTLVAPTDGVVVNGELVPGGSVVFVGVVNNGATILDGVTFRAAAETGSELSREPANVSLQSLRNLLAGRRGSE